MIEAIYLNIALAVVGTILAIVSIGGETWRKDSEKWHHHLTTRGWLSVALLICVAGLTVWKEHNQDQEQANLNAQIDEMRRSMGSVLTHEEFSLVNIGTSAALLIERLGQPIVDTQDEHLVCSGTLRYLRWSDVGRNSIQVLVDGMDRVVGFSLFSNSEPVRYASVTLEPWTLWNPSPDSRDRLISYGDARFFGFVDDLGSGAPNNYHTIYVGWDASREHSEAIFALEKFYDGHNQIVDPENWEAELGMTYGDYRALIEDLRVPKLGVFSDFSRGDCLEEPAGDEPGDEQGRAASEVDSGLVFFTFASFEIYEWWYLELQT